MDVPGEIRDLFVAVGARGFLHAMRLGSDIDSAPQVDVDADEPVVLASAFKVPVAVALARAFVDGSIDATEMVTVGGRYRTGGVGTAGCADDVTVSWRDLTRFMLTMSDNAATDVIYQRLGADRIDKVLADVGLTRTRIVGCCEDLFATLPRELGIDPSASDAADRLAAVPPEAMWRLSVLDPERTSASTPREMTRLVAAIWDDSAGPAAACAQVRDLMAEQIWPHRISSGFGAEVHLAGKTGTLPGIRNEVAVATYPDGQAYAVAVFTRAESLEDRQPRIDGAIGAAARSAIDHLRAS